MGALYLRHSRFQPEILGSFGNVRRNPYHGPGINNTNMIVAKNFMIVPERNISIQIRLESDNVFNHTQLATQPPTSPAATSESSLRPQLARQTQLGAKIYF